MMFSLCSRKLPAGVELAVNQRHVMLCFARNFFVMRDDDNARARMIELA